MDSRQAIKEESEEAAARVALDRLSDVNKERRRNIEEGTWPDQLDSHAYNQQEQEQKGPRVLGSLLKSAGETYEQVKDAVSGKAPNAPHHQYKDYYGSENKADGAMSTAKAKDDAVGKTGEYALTEKAEEGRDAVGGRMMELKESAAAAARRARDYLTGQSEALDRKGDEEKYENPEFEARKKMQELKLKEEGVHDEAKQRAAADWETAADRGIAARRNIYGAMGCNLKETIKEKLTYPTDIVKEARATQEYGGPKRGGGGGTW